MAVDDGLAQVLRDDLADENVIEKKMMGGICFMWQGHMLCATHKHGTLFRVGPPGMTAALAIPGVAPMRMTGRVMKGFVDCNEDASADDVRRGQLMAMAREFVMTLPPKERQVAFPDEVR